MAEYEDRKLSVVSERDVYPEATGEGLPTSTVVKITRLSGILSTLVAGLALFSDGYNAQIIGYMEPFFSVLYKDGISSEIKTRLSNSYLIGEIFGMLFFGMDYRSARPPDRDRLRNHFPDPGHRAGHCCAW